MVDRVFETPESARKAISDNVISRLGLEAANVDAIVDAVLPIWEEAQQIVRAPGAKGLQIPAIRWVIPDDDLRLFDAILDGVKAAAGTGFFFLAVQSPSPSQ
jgi:hypothetical protein